MRSAPVCKVDVQALPDGLCGAGRDYSAASGVQCYWRLRCIGVHGGACLIDWPSSCVGLVHEAAQPVMWIMQPLLVVIHLGRALSHRSSYALTWCMVELS